MQDKSNYIFVCFCKRKREINIANGNDETKISELMNFSSVFLRMKSKQEGQEAPTTPPMERLTYTAGQRGVCTAEP